MKAEKRVVIVHGWDGHPDEIWFPWLKRKLLEKGFSVSVPQMPGTNKPDIKKWIGKISRVVGVADKNTYFVGHSIGSQAIIRFLEKSKGKIGGSVHVAGWFSLTNLDESEIPFVKPWLNDPIDFRKVRKNGKKFIAILSDNDQYVPFAENKAMFRKNLGAKIVVEKGKGHIGSEEKIKELPSALDAVLMLAGKKK